MPFESFATIFRGLPLLPAMLWSRAGHLQVFVGIILELFTLVTHGNELTFFGGHEQEKVTARAPRSFHMDRPCHLILFTRQYPT